VVVAPDGSALAWSGITDPAPLLEALRYRQAHRFRRAETPHPTTLSVRGLSRPLRVVAWQPPGEVGVVLGVTPPSAQPLLARLAATLATLWAVVVAIGATLATWSVRHALRRVETITRAAAAIDEPETGRRLEGGEARDEIGELATTLNGMLDRIAAGAREIRRMSQDAAHDLRTPLTVIRGRLEVALARAPDGDWQAEVAEAVEGLDRLAAMLEAILDVAEAEGSALRLRRESVDLAELAAELVDLYAPAAEERGLELGLRSSGPVVLRADPHMVRRAVANLLDNALHHARGGTRVDVRVTRSAGGEASLEVADDGPGFAPGLGESVFLRTVRDPDSPGFGLGLPLVRAAARAHGGEAKAGGSDLGGASVTVRLPLGDRSLTESSSK
jgi:signal transduction histidine kinase